jgi:glycosyltransferase 2 family protein
VRATIRRLCVISVLVLLLWVGWYWVDWRNVGTTIAHTSPLPLVGCIVIYFVGVWLSCVKWRWLLRVQRIDAPLLLLMRWYLVGSLTGTLLPSDVGGDLGRGYLAGRTFGNAVAVASSVIAERISGVVALALLAVGAWVVMPSDTAMLLLMGSGIIGVGSLALGLFFVSTKTVLRRWLHGRFAHLGFQVSQTWRYYKGSPAVLAQCVAVSLIFHLLNAFSLWLIVFAIDPADAPLRAMLVMPLVGLLGLLPLTPGGIGIREGSLAVLLVNVGVTADHAVATALLSRALLFVVVLSGVPAFLTEYRKRAHRMTIIQRES